MKNAVVFLADGFEEIEGITVIDYLRRAGVQVFTVTVPSSMTKQKNISVGSHNISVITDLSFEQFETKFFKDLPDLVYIPGGIPGAPNNAKSQGVLNFVKKMFDSGKIVSSICASPAVVLAKTGILKGKKWTCYPGMENNLAEYCGSEENAKICTENSVHIKDVPFVSDKNLLTGRGPGTTEQFAMEAVRLLCGEDVALKVKTASIQR